MGRFIYKHFGSDIPRNIEKEYNRMLRKEQYQRERDAENGLIEVDDFEQLISYIADPASLPENEIAEEQKRIHDKRLYFLSIAMETLRTDYPEEYALIREYYYSNDNVTVYNLMKKYGVSRSVIRTRLSHAREILKKFILMYEHNHSEL